MFRRIGLRFGSFAATPVVMQAATTTSAPATTDAASNSSGNNKSANNKKRRPNDNVEYLFNSQPAVSFNKISEDISSGYYLRFTYTQAAVLLKRIAQNKVRTGDDKSRIFGGDESFLQLPATTVARMLAVLDGNLDECKVIGRSFKGSFKTGGQPNTFVLSCTSNQSNADRQNGGAPSQPTEWTVNFDVADSVLLQRFLKQSLHYLQGFYHSQQE